MADQSTPVELRTRSTPRRASTGCTASPTRRGPGPGRRSVRWSPRAQGCSGRARATRSCATPTPRRCCATPTRSRRRSTREHIGQFMGDLILAMNGPEHRTYRNLVAKAFRASQLERWDETLVQPDDRPAARRDRAARARRPRRVGHVGVSGAGDLRHRGRAARRRRAVRAWAEQINTGPLSPEQGMAASQAMVDYLRPLVEARRAEPTGDFLSDLVHERGRRRAAHRLEDLRVPPTAVAGGRGDDVPRHGQLPVRVAVAPRRPRAGVRRPRAAAGRDRRDAAVGDVGHAGESGRHPRHRGGRLPDHGRRRRSA